MPETPIVAEKVHAILLKDATGTPVGMVIKNGHWVFYELGEMNDDSIMELFRPPMRHA